MVLVIGDNVLMYISFDEHVLLQRCVLSCTAKHFCVPCMTLFSQPATTCADYPITNYTVHLNTTLTNDTTSHTLNPDLPLRLQLNSTNGLVKDTHYIYYITAENRAGTGVSQSKEMGKYSNEEGTGQEEQYIIIQSGIVGLEYLEKECSLIICFTEMYIIYTIKSACEVCAYI